MIVEMEERHIPGVGRIEAVFNIIGRIVPRFEGGVWTYEERLNRGHRRQRARAGRGIGTALMHRAQAWARERGLGGLMLETQENNVLACRFYRRQGMTIGAVDTMLYANTPYAKESAVFWYRRF